MAKNGEATLWIKIKTAGEDALSSLSASFDKIKEVGVGAFAALSGVFAKALSDYREQEEATNALTQAMVNNGIYSKALKDDYLSQASALQKLTTFGDEQIIAAQAALQQQIGQTKITKDLTLAILDFASAQKMDAASAAELVGKSIATSTNALGRYGIEVNSSADSSTKMAQVLEGLNGKFHGQAAAAAQGLGGILQLKNAISDLFEILGEKITPVFSVFVQALTGIATNAQSTEPIINALVGVFNFAARAAIYVTDIFRGLGDTIGITLAAAVEAGNAAMTLSFQKLRDTGTQYIDQLAEAQVARAQSRNDLLAQLDQAMLDQQANKNKSEEDLLTQTLDRQREIKIQKKLEETEALLQQEITDQDRAIQLQGESASKQFQLQAEWEMKRAQSAKSHEEKVQALKNVSQLKQLESEAKDREKRQQEEKKEQEEMLKNREQTLNKIASMQNSSNSTLAAIGKAAALTQIAIETPVAIARALGSAPPPFNFALAAAVGAAMADQAARVSGVQLAEGGIVRARPGGIQATIGEGGQDEAVIPLDRAGDFGFGGSRGVVINVYGGMLGDERSAHEFAIAVDRKLYELRKNNESVAFDEGLS